jgi:hypothetical protein
MPQRQAQVVVERDHDRRADAEHIRNRSPREPAWPQFWTQTRGNEIMLGEMS